MAARESTGALAPRFPSPERGPIESRQRGAAPGASGPVGMVSAGSVAFERRIPAHLSIEAGSRLLASGRVGVRVLDAVAAAGTAPVIVRLDLARFAGLRSGERVARERRLALVPALVDGVLAILAAGEFELRRRFGGVAALAGDVDPAGLARLIASPHVAGVALDAGGSAGMVEAAALVGLDELTQSGLGGEGVTVAVVDSGYDGLHEALSDDLLAERCFCDADSGGCCPDGSTSQTGPGSARDDFGHGTHVAGVITSAGGTAPVGGAPDAGIVAVRILDGSGRMHRGSDLVAALDWIAEQHPEVAVVNMSLGTDEIYPGDCDDADDLTRVFRDAVDNLADEGVLVVASAGNSSGDEQASRQGMTAPI